MATRVQLSTAGAAQLFDNQATVFRVGYEPDPFAWTPWQYAANDCFNGRWDDPAGQFRTLYVGDRLLGCLLEVLAAFRPDLGLSGELEAIDVDDDDDAIFPTALAGTVPRSWLKPRCAARAALTGRFVDVRTAETVATLRNRFGRLAAQLGLTDLDAAAVKLGEPRMLTQAIAAWLYSLVPPLPPLNGVCFGSRHSDLLLMWAIFERPHEATTGSRTLAAPVTIDLNEDLPDLIEAFRIFGLSWSD